MSSQHSVSQWIAELKDKDADAANQLWKRYSERLMQLARKRLGNAPRRVSDEEDVALSVFHCLCRGAAEGRLDDVKSRDELWWLLIRLTQQKAVDYVRKETAKKRGGGEVRSEGYLAGTEGDAGNFSLDCLIGDDPTPDSLAILDEEYKRVLELLQNDTFRRIATLRIEGYSVKEIAEELSQSRRSIERKLRLVRETWAQELG